MTLGIIAGSGSFPLQAARNAKTKGAKVVSVGFEGITSPELSSLSDRHSWIGLGQLSKLLRFFRDEGVQGVMLAGTVEHGKALQTTEAIKAVADLRTLKILFSIRRRNATSLLTAMIQEIEKEGMRVLPSFTYLENQLLKPGPAGSIKPSKDDLEDIATGYEAAKALSRLDIGLTVCVAGGVVLAVEAMEGTDACIARAGDLLAKRSSRSGGFTIVKVARPNQDPRFDLPVIGPQTITTAHNAGARCLAAESGWTLMLEPEAAVSLADQHKISLYGISTKK